MPRSLVLGDVENLAGGHCNFYPKEDGILIDVHSLNDAIKKTCGDPIAQYMFYADWLDNASYGIMKALNEQFKDIGYIVEAAPKLSARTYGTASLSYDVDAYMIEKGSALIDTLNPQFDTLVILSGDGDFLPLAKYAEDFGKRVFFANTHCVNSTIKRKYGTDYIIEIPTFSYKNKNIVKYANLS